MALCLSIYNILMLYLYHHKNNGVMFSSHQVMLITYTSNTARHYFNKIIFPSHVFSVSLSF